ncbi:hypothetical protein L596_026449 [Steinernema carpocapsae]|uniref:Uncharacterized protein n=1 Tax=Steinernema carpocapsae TaxID=34508 RepID=A0A4U5M1E9_STECR|nr:hypothetical protein L596_026449 [Steinernema carpocapsae]
MLTSSNGNHIETFEAVSYWFKEIPADARETLRKTKKITLENATLVYDYLQLRSNAVISWMEEDKKEVFEFSELGCSDLAGLSN